MNKFILIIAFLQSATYAQQPKDNLNKIKGISLEEAHTYTRLQDSKQATSASKNFDVTYYRCEWQVDPAVRYIRGKVTSYFKLTTDASAISFDLMNDLTVDSVKLKSRFLTFSHADNTLEINFGSTIPAGSLDSVTIYYEGVPPNTGFGSYVNAVHAGVPVMWTLSEPYGSRDWWPCKNGLDDKADSIDVIITAPAQYTAASNGLRQSEIIEGANKITHWKHRYPIASYLVCMAVTNYKETEDYVQIGNINLLMQTFCYPEDSAIFRQNTPNVLSALQYFSSVFGAYPFIKEKYGHVQFSWGGGQEHQTSTFIVSPDEGLMAHELAHQWFGDKITCGSWQHIWLNEGFATHLASMYFENKYPLTIIPNRKIAVDVITAVPNGSVFVSDTTNANRIFEWRLSYIKASHLLYMLRWILGDSVFFNGVRKYLNDPTINFGFATTNDLKRNLEEASGKDLTYFFNDWFYGQGYPSYHIQWSAIGNDYVKIKMDQTTSDPSVPFFALPVALQFKNATQQKTIIVDNKFNGEIFFKQLGFKPDTVFIDPEYWLITKNNVAEKVPDNLNGTNVIKIFPNPVADHFYVYLSNFSSQNASLKIYDNNGRLLLNKNLSINGSAFFEINSKAFATGIYFIKIQADNGVKFAKKILKQ